MSKDFLQIKAHELRRDVIKMLELAGSGHPAGALGLAEVFSALYFEIMKNDPDDPDWEDRDILFLSNGHVAPILYASLAHAGYFSRAELATLRRLGSRLQGHPERIKLPGVENTSGPLGSGLSQASGYAYSLQYFDKQTDRFVYCVMSDGELDEGNTWEAVMFASKYRLGQLIAIVDRNQIQLSGKTQDVMPLESLEDKWRAFGWDAQSIDGHDIDQIIDSVNRAKQLSDRPSVIIAKTIPGKGVDFMENDYKWHGKAPNPEQSAQAISQIKRQIDSEVKHD
ncbi:transketolase [Candidatus Saccharibacteria bacterium]|nr:MAG: transketolase [Candidatus Saccharibacteria bacterium]